MQSYGDYCALARISAEDQAIGLTTLLSSNLRAALDNLSANERRDFPTVRATLLRAGAYTQEACQNCFFEADPSPEETTLAYLHRKQQLFNDWLQAAGVGDHMIKDFIVVDDFLHHMPPSFGAYVREGDSYAIRTVSNRGDRYLDLHHSGRRLASVQQKHLQREGMKCTRCHHPAKINHQHRHQQQNNHHRKDQGPHQNQGSTKNSYHGAPNGNGTSKSTHQAKPPLAGLPRRYCSYHRSHSHSTEECQTKQHEKQPPWKQKGLSAMETSLLAAPPADFLPPQEAPEPDTVTTSSSSNMGTAPQHYSQHEEPWAHPYGSTARLSTLSIGNSSLLQTCEGELNGHQVTILLDSGAEGIFVDRALVHDSQFTGETVQVKWPEGAPVHRPLCRVYINCPYYTGTYLAVALNQPAQSVYLGHVPGSLPFPGNAAAKEFDKALQNMLPQSPESTDALGSDGDALRTSDVQAQTQIPHFGDSVPHHGGTLSTLSTDLSPSATVQTCSGSQRLSLRVFCAPRPADYELLKKATREGMRSHIYVDTVALHSPEAETVINKSFLACSTFGFSQVLTLENETNIKETFEAFWCLLEVCHLIISVFHAQSSSICERYQGTLTRCLSQLFHCCRLDIESIHQM